MEVLLIALMTIAALLVKVRYLKNLKLLLRLIKILKFTLNRLNFNLKYNFELKLLQLH